MELIAIFQHLLIVIETHIDQMNRFNMSKLQPFLPILANAGGTGGGGGEVRWPSLALLFTLILPFRNDVRIARLWWLQLPLFLPSQSYFAFSSPARDALHCEIESQVGLILLP